MYLEHFGLQEFPFSTAPDPRFYFPTGKHREALACLLYTVQQRKGFALVSGEVGAGKTMLCRTALERLGDSVESATICHTTLTPTEFLQACVSGFGLDAENKPKTALIRDFRQFLINCDKRGRTPVLIVDEAQNLSVETLEEVRLLGNLETDTQKLLQIVLVGQPELRRLVATYQLRQLDQRIALKFHLSTLTAEDTHEYILHRLRVAGAGEREIFDGEARARVHTASEGIPRIINSICDQSMLHAFINDLERIDGETVEEVVADREGYYMSEADERDWPEGVTADRLRRDMHKKRMRCPRCNTTLTVYEKDVGRAGRCPNCGRSVTVLPELFKHDAHQTPRPMPTNTEAAGGANENQE